MKWLLVVSVTLAPTFRGQYLPGMDEKPESPIDTMADCATATNALLSLGAIRSEFNRINSQFASDDLENSCQEEKDGNTYICDVDYSRFENNLKSICESNNGQYDEREHQVGCEGPDGSVIVYKVSNYPTCYDDNCEAPDLERFISREVEDLEQSLAQELNMECNSEYEIEDDDGDGEESQGNEGNYSNNQCPNLVNASPNTCGPLESKASGQLCDCYTFCNGELIACETFDNPTRSIACQGDLVAGCNYTLFGMYDVAKSSSNHVSVVASFMLLVFVLLF
jgi:hypothetical protein